MKYSRCKKCSKKGVYAKIVNNSKFNIYSKISICKYCKNVSKKEPWGG